MEQRVSRLGQFVNEAQWRHQLVSWDQGLAGGKNGRGLGPRKKSRKFKQVVNARAEPDVESDCTNGVETPGEGSAPGTI